MKDEAEQVCSAELAATPANAESSDNIHSQNGGKSLSQGSSLPTATSDITRMTPEELEVHLENAELDRLLNKYATKCIAEANRQLTRLETERRQMRSQSVKLSTYGWLSDETTDRLFDMIGNPHLKLKGRPSAPRDSIDDEKILADLWTLKRVLQALDFPAVLEAISHVTQLTVRGSLAANTDLIPGLLEAFEWYASQNQSDWLPGYEQVSPRKPEDASDTTMYQEASGE